MTAMDWWFIAGWFGLSVTIAALFSLLSIASKRSDEWDRLARKPYVPPSYQRCDVNLVTPVFDFERHEQEVSS